MAIKEKPMQKKKDEIQMPQRDISLYKYTGKMRLNNSPVLSFRME